MKKAGNKNTDGDDGFNFPPEVVKEFQSYGAPLSAVKEFLICKESVDKVEKDLAYLIRHPYSRHYILNRIFDIIRDLGHYRDNCTEEEVGRFLFNIASFSGMAIINLASNPPAWFTEFARMQCMVPWVYANGKPFPTFAETDERLKWGSGLAKRGKNRADAFSTFHVLWCLQAISHDRAYMADPKRGWIVKYWAARKDGDTADMMRANALPALSLATKDEWWNEIKMRIRAQVRLPDAYRKNLAETVKDAGHSDALIMNEHLKRCKKAFSALVP